MPNAIGRALNNFFVSQTNNNEIYRAHIETAPLKASVLFTGKELVERMGRPPKNNIVLFGHAFKTNSTEYKQTLSKLEDYHKALSELSDMPVGQLGPAKDDLVAKLLDIMNAADAYVLKHEGEDPKAARSFVMRTLRDTAAKELETLNSIGEEGFNDAQQVNLLEAVALKRAGVGSDAHPSEMLNDTSLNREESVDKFAQGGLNTVSKLVFDCDGEKKTRIVKLLVNEKRELEDGEQAIGMDRNNLQIAARNQATEITARALGIDHLAPRSDVILHDGQAMLAMTVAPGEEALGYVEQRFTGNEARQYDLLDPETARALNMERTENGDWVRKQEAGREIPVTGGKNPELEASLQEQLLDLQLLDCLCGQVDRHLHNIYIRIDGDTARVTGIDNDMSFGSNTTIWNRKFDNEFSNGSYSGAPPLMSRKSYEALMALDPDTYRNSLPQGLSEPERDRAMQRLIDLKEHASGLEERGLVITDFTATITEPVTQQRMSISEFLTTENVSGEGPRNYVDKLSSTYRDLIARGQIAPLDPEKHGAI
jgi:hypothetical protein